MRVLAETCTEQQAGERGAPALCGLSELCDVFTARVGPDPALLDGPQPV